MSINANFPIHVETGWEADVPRPEHSMRIRPTLILYCGFEEEDRNALQDGVGSRLESNSLGDIIFPGEVVVQEQAENTESLDELRTKFQERLSRLFLIPELQRIDHDTYGAVDTSIPLTWNLVLICRQGDAETGITTQFLTDVAEAARTAFMMPISCSLRLIMLYRQGDLDGYALHEYWPRFTLADQTPSGAQITPELLLNVTENLIVALVGSGLTEAVDAGLARESRHASNVEWLGAGASAILADQTAMLRYLENDYYLWLTDPLEPNVPQGQNVQNIGVPSQSSQTLLSDYLARQWEIVTEQLDRHHWVVNGTFDSSSRQTLVDQRRIESLNAKPSSPTGQMLATLRGRPDLLKHNSEQLVTRLIAALNTATQTHVQLVYQALHGMLRNNLGLASTIVQLEELDNQLERSWDFLYEGAPAVPLLAPDPASLDALAYHQVRQLDGVGLQLRRVIQQHLTLWGMILYLIPAWALTYGIIRSFYQDRPLLVALGTLLVAAAIAAIFYRNIKIDIEAQRRSLTEELEKSLANSVIRLVTQITRNATFLMYQHHRERLWMLQSLHSLMERRRSKRRYDQQNSQNCQETIGVVIARVADFDYCQEQVKISKEEKDRDAKDNGGTTYPIRRLNDWVIPRIGNPLAPRAVHNEYVRESQQFARELLSNVAGGFLSASSIATKCWKRGDYWDWLDKNAYALAVAGHGVEFSVAIGHVPAVFTGGGMAHFKQEWLQSYSRLYLELIVVRVVVLN